MKIQPAIDQPTDALEGFRADVRAFIEQNVPRPLRERVLLGKPATRDETMDWHRTLYRRGWVAPAWPQVYGGPGWDLETRWAFEEEYALAGAPPLSAPGVTTVGPVIIASGTADQKKRYLQPILDGSEIWCQGFSEPNAGSDLAALQCKAEPVQGGYLVTGTKIWTTHAHWADLCLLLARTSRDGPRQSGITMLILDMHAEGVSVRPIVTLDGLHVLNQCFFDRVLVKSEDRLGVEGEAWSILKDNIGHERILVANPGLVRVLRQRLLALAGRTDEFGARPIDNPALRARIVDHEVRLLALEATAKHVLSKPDLALRPEASLLKVVGTELQQDYTRLLGDVLGVASLPVNAAWLASEDGPSAVFDPITPNYLFMRKASISAGTNEVQRDIIARALLR